MENRIQQSDFSATCTDNTIWQDQKLLVNQLIIIHSLFVLSYMEFFQSVLSV